MERQRRRAAFVRSHEARDVVFTVGDAPLDLRVLAPSNVWGG